MVRAALALLVIAALALPLAGCGGADRKGTTTQPPAEGAAPVHPGADNAQEAARKVAAYKLAVNEVLGSYSVAQKKAFRSLRGADDAPRFVAALKRLRHSTALAANRLSKAQPPASAAAAHARFVAAFRSLARVIQSAIDARNRSDFNQLRRVGRRLSSGEFSRPITRAAKQIDAALSSP